MENPKFLAFVGALRKLCEEHGVTLSTSGYDFVQVWDDDVDGYKIYDRIEDCTIPTPKTDKES